ncbi:MAG TPA: hypothetical protein VGZ26_01790 [Pirellulales bacterium]|nr:hypothetical protein [Pirellulales bacterium]
MIHGVVEKLSIFCTEHISVRPDFGIDNHRETFARSDSKNVGISARALAKGPYFEPKTSKRIGSPSLE